MSQARIQKAMATSMPATSTHIEVAINIPKKIFNKLKEMDNTQLLIFSNEKNANLTELLHILKHTNQLLQHRKTSTDHKITLERYKAALMQCVLNYLDNLYRERIKARENKKQSRVLYWLKLAFMGLVSLISLAEGALGSFLGAKGLLSAIIPNIAGGWLMVASIAFTAINVVLFMAFQIDMLKTMLGVDTSTHAKKILQAHEEQIDFTDKINAKLTNVNVVSRLTREEYKELSQITLLFNKDVAAKEEMYQKYKEHPAKKAIRWIIAGLGAITTVMGTYFGAVSLLAAIAAPLIGTPIGWAIIGVLIAATLVFYLAMQNTTMTNLFNPALNLFNKVKEKMAAFIPKTDLDFNNTLLNRNIFRKKPTATIKALDLPVDISCHQKRNNFRRLSGEIPRASHAPRPYL